MYSLAVGTSANGHQVYMNTISSAAGRCFSREPHLIRIAKAVVESLELAGCDVCLTRDIGRVIGNTNIVATKDSDQIFYAQQPKGNNVLRFVKKRSMEPSSELSLILQVDAEGNYEVTDAWIGPACPPFPGTNGATIASKAYWQDHALTAGSEPISLQSVTSVCPY